MTDRIAYSPREIIKKTGLSRNTIYRAIKNGQIKSVRVGTRILIPKWAIEEVMNHGLQDQTETKS